LPAEEVVAVRRRVRFILLAAGVAAIVVAAGTASGTPPVGTATTTPLNTGTVVDAVHMPASAGVKISTNQSVDVVQVNTVVTISTANPLWTSGWHMHAGPVIVNIKSGSITIYGPSCEATTYGPGQAAGSAFVEPPNEPVLARITVSTEWFTTQIIPHGGPTRIDLVPGLCGLS